jgi:hypothetical protein
MTHLVQEIAAMRKLCLALTAAAIFLPASAADAGYAFGFDQASYLAAPGGTIDVSVYLQETGASSLVTDGLTGAGVAVRFDVSPVPNQPAQVLSDAGIAASAAFDTLWGKSAQPSLGYADLSLGAYGSLVYGVETPPDSGTYRVSLGTFTFTAGSASNETTLLLATNYDSTLTNNVTGAFAVLDGLIQNGTASITTTFYGDANLDGTVNGADLNDVLSNYNRTGMNWANGDFNRDGTVNGADLNALLSNYNNAVGLEAAMDVGQSATPSAAAIVPEPSALILGGIAALALFAFRRRRRRT